MLIDEHQPRSGRAEHSAGDVQELIQALRELGLTKLDRVKRIRQALNHPVEIALRHARSPVSGGID